MPSQVAQLALQSNAQAAAIARQRLANLKVPPEAQQAAALLQQRKAFAAHQQQLAMARNGTMANNMPNAVQNGTLPQTSVNGNAAPVIKTEQDSHAQMSSLQTNTPFSLTMPPVTKRASNATMPPASSPPKGSMAVPPNSTPQRTAQNLQMNDTQPPQANAPAASQTPRQTPATPQVLPQPVLTTSAPQGNPAQQQGMVTAPGQLASYHQGLVNGQQNQLHTMIQGNTGYPNAANAGVRPIYPGVGNNYSMNGAAGARPPMLQQQMGVGQMNMMQQQMIQNYQMNMGGFPQVTQGMHPTMQQQMLQIQQLQQNAAVAAAGSIYAAANGMNMQASVAQAQAQAQAQQQQAFHQSLLMRVDASMQRMTPDAIAEMATRAPDHVKQTPQWATSSDREKARLTMYSLFKQKILTERRQQAAANAANNQQR